MGGIVSLLLFSSMLTQSLPPGQPMAAPSLPFFDWKACPYEGCSYREWTAQKEMPVYDTWQASRREIAKIAPGAKAIGIDGLVITFRPGTVRLDRDMPLQHFKTGDTILTYSNRGEGFSAVWFKDNFHSDFDISFAKLPDGTGCGNEHCAATYVDLGLKEWWAKVKYSADRIGWVLMSSTNSNRFELNAGN